jgi:hypothetical protein
MLTESLEKMRHESFEQGMEHGELIEKQNILIKQLSQKYGLEEEEKKYIKSITNFEKLDMALDKILFSKDKKQVLDCLK